MKEGHLPFRWGAAGLADADIVELLTLRLAEKRLLCHYIQPGEGRAAGIGSSGSAGIGIGNERTVYREERDQ